MSPRLVAFDFDGTLADSFAVFSEVFDEVATRFGLRRPTTAEVELWRGLGNRELLRRLDVPLVRVPAIMRFARTRMAARAEQVSLVAGAPALLAALAERQVVVAVVSSNGEGLVRRVLGPSGVHVRALACGTSLFGKAARLRALRRRFGVRDAEGAYVGDEERDIVAAREARLQSIAVTWGYASPVALTGADVVCSSMAALAAWLGVPAA